MRKLFLTIFLIMGNMLWSQELLNRIVNDGDISLLENEITINQFRNFTKNDLRILRNTIYAKHGYIFNSRDLRDHFSQFSWYNEVTTNIENELTIIDRVNIELIQRIERNYPENIITANQLIGNWYYYGGVAAEGIDKIESLYSMDRILILPNGIYIFYPWSPHADIFYGLWSLKNTTFETIPLGEHLPYIIPTYGKVDNFKIDTMELNDGSKHLVCRLVSRGNWAKK